MTVLGHSVLRHTLEVRVPSETLALALQPRLSDFDARTVVPALARVLDELDDGVQYARLGRIEVDLGTLPAAELEPHLAERLLPELRRAIGAALEEAAARPSPGRHLVTIAAARRQLLEHYLVNGTLPFWGPHPSRFALADLVRTLADEDPRALVAAVRGLSDRPHVLERIAAQVGEPLLERWVALLEPRHARLIVAYVRDLRGVHRVVRLVALGDQEFAEALWVLTQAYLLRDPGSQFNRKSFLRSLLQGLAGRRGVDYAALLATLERGLVRMGRRRGWHASLPGVVGALVREAALARADPAPPSQPSPDARDRTPDGVLVARLTQAPGLRRVLSGVAGRRVLRALAAARAAGRRLTPRLLAAALCLLARARDLPPLDGIRAYVASQRARGRLSAAQAAIVEDALGRLDGRTPRVRSARRRAVPRTREALLALLRASTSAGRSEERQDAPAADAAGSSADAEPPPLDDEPLSALARRGLENPFRREEWARTLPESALEGLVRALEPERHRELIGSVEVLAAAWRGVLPPGRKGLAGRTLRWTFVLDFLARSPVEGRTVERLAEAFCAFFASRYRASAAPAAEGEDLGGLLLERADRLARSAGNSALVAVLERGRRRLRTPWESGSEARNERTASARPASDAAKEIRRAAGARAEDDERDAVAVDNAGLVLVGPFLPHLLRTLDLLDEGPDGRPRLRDRAAATRAVHLLQYLVDGRTSAAEPELALNKVLCGLLPAASIGREAELGDRERELADQLLRALLARWPALGGTSPAGLRETFLRREGRLRRSPDGWRLRVQRKTVDVLVDQIPWSLSVVLHPWMPDPLYVTW